MSETGEGFGTWLRGKMLERRMSLAQLSREAGCDYTYLWRIINADSARGRRYVRPSYTLTRKVGESLGAMREALVVAGFEDLSPEAAREADRQAALDADVSRLSELAGPGDLIAADQLGGGPLPLLGHIQAGDLNEALENAEGFVPIPEAIGHDADFALRVRGESMNPTLLEGDLVAVRIRPTAEPGQLVVARMDDEAQVKRYEVLEGVPTLVADNPEWPSVRVGPNVRILGVVTGSYRPPEVLLRRPR